MLPDTLVAIWVLISIWFYFLVSSSSGMMTISIQIFEVSVLLNKDFVKT